jgi:hypothetical protein
MSLLLEPGEESQVLGELYHRHLAVFRPIDLTA